jgi:hypothetical protein
MRAEFPLRISRIPRGHPGVVGTHSRHTVGSKLEKIEPKIQCRAKIDIFT